MGVSNRESFKMNIGTTALAPERYNVPTSRAITHDFRQVVRSSQSTQSMPVSDT